jgi:solute carrier family 29 (equilibrative nucleoside transporter) protein 4
MKWILLYISGYLVSFFTLFFVAICEIGLDMFETSTAYTINLIAVAIVALGCTGKTMNFQFCIIKFD